MAAEKVRVNLCGGDDSRYQVCGHYELAVSRAEAAEDRVAELEAAIGGLFEVVTTTPFADHHAFANERVRALHDAWKGDQAK